MTERRPIRVYLDSQDFISLSKRPLSDPSAAIFEDLVSLRIDGIAEFGVSLFHIAEVLNPDSEGFEDYQRHCGEVIYALTGGAAFPYLGDVQNGAAFPNNGVWAPASRLDDMKALIDAKSIKRMVGEALQDCAPFSRQQRRMIANPKTLMRLMEKTMFDLPPEFAMIGMTKAEFYALVRDPPRGRRAFHSKLMRFFTDPRHYCAAVASVRRGQDPIRRILEEGLAEPRAKINTLVDSIRLNRTREAGIRLIHEAAVSHAVQTYGEASDEVKRTRGEYAAFERETKRVPRFSRSHAISPRLDYFRTYCEALFRMDRDPSPSEVLDLCHLAYHPDVDLIRVDGRMFDMMRGFAPIKGKMVAKLKDLPDAIRRASQ